MNSEINLLVPKAILKKPETLARVCWNFSDVLMGRRWMYDEVRSAEIKRSVAEAVGIAELMGSVAVKPLMTEASINFVATKSLISEPGEKLVDAETYYIELTMSQSVDHKEIPAYLLDEIFDEHKSDDEHDHDTDTVMDFVEKDTIDDVSIMQEQTISYHINGDGEIEYYSLTFGYTFEDEKVYENYYSSEQGERITAPVKLAESGEIVDDKPVVLEDLSDAQLEREIKDIDTAWKTFAEESTAEEVARFGGQSQLDHRRQALAMIGMVASGMATLRQLASHR